VWEGCRRRAGWAFIALVLAASGCGAGHQGGRRATSATPPAHELKGPAFGLSEGNANLLWNPGAQGRTGGEAFQATRIRLSALEPTYIRLLVDWAALQPSESKPPLLAMPADGCARGVAPCGPYAGIRDELAAIASQQRAAPGSFQVVIDIFGAPSWAALAPYGCESASTAAFARPLRAQALSGYRALIDSLLTLGAAEGVSLDWWSPWNEPNDPRFISPQRVACSDTATPLSPAVYAQLVRALHSELQAHGSTHNLLLGELNDLQLDSPHTTSVASFIAAPPADVFCLGAAWSIHAYAARHAGGAPLAAVNALEQALATRGACATGAPIWVTEAGAGAPHPGRPRPSGGADELAGCQELARQLLGWYRDPRVAAVFQYSFREDPAFPVGLESAHLTHIYPAYRLWHNYVQTRLHNRPPLPPASACA
jgi:hypothetical protein